MVAHASADQSRVNSTIIVRTYYCTGLSTRRYRISYESHEENENDLHQTRGVSASCCTGRDSVKLSVSDFITVVGVNVSGTLNRRHQSLTPEYVHKPSLQCVLDHSTCHLTQVMIIIKHNADHTMSPYEAKPRLVQA
jgi:hypothetical protein